MKKTHLLLTALTMFAVLFVSCSSDDDNTEPEEETLDVEGEWKFKEVNFLDKETVEWDDELAFTPNNTVKYAPFMLSEVWGYDLQGKEVEEGKRVEILQGFYTDYDEDEVLWYWNYTDEEEAFEIVQTNDQFPPYDFGIENVKNVEVQDDGETVVFEAIIKSREVGSEFTDPLIDVPVEMTWERGVADENNQVEVLIEGELFEFPSVQP